ncbi:RBBP9/YdeN family alpha/beta hydrolase [Salinarimonas soli]|uniref:Serine hydrolase family protein n=1 Tax=Salinarimonas soli TaxID=1638099 RepID=A0A5B2VE10_9HYPH|nr:alpha/beta hydrolase [Salinarimonas soli]KAA2237763.1 serine hydrolase family protein [Salinarimonas soli]
MRTFECDILIVPGLGNSGPDHWQTRWERQLSTARRVRQADYERPRPQPWIETLVRAVAPAQRPVVLVAHSLGVVTIAAAAERLAGTRVAGAFLVTPPDLDDESRRPPAIDPGFAPMPRAPLPFPSVLVASRTDPYCAYERAEDFAFAWGSALVDAGDAGHLNTESGHGPWPEGLMRFAGLLRQL